MVGLLFLLAFVLLFGLFSSDYLGVSTIDAVHEQLKEKPLTLAELENKLGWDYKTYNNGDIKRYVWMKHSTGTPVRFLDVVFDKKLNYVSHKFSIGWKEVQ